MFCSFSLFLLFFLLCTVIEVSGYLSSFHHTVFSSLYRVKHVSSSFTLLTEKQGGLRRSPLFAVKDEVQQLINQHKCMIFSKAQCPYCKDAKWAITNAGMSFFAIELDVSYISHSMMSLINHFPCYYRISLYFIIICSCLSRTSYVFDIFIF
jgi:thioredoxin-related protein